jgi:fatty-acyl-CoA synthase
MGHCRSQITERAAIPRTVRFIEAMPLTAVGKIFKPDLRLDVIRHCVRNVAARLDEARTLGVEVRETGGTIVVVLAVPDPSMAGAVDNVRRELERYTFRVEVETSYPTGSAPFDCGERARLTRQ